jgi:hypothetical protein
MMVLLFIFTAKTPRTPRIVGNRQEKPLAAQF